MPDGRLKAVVLSCYSRQMVTSALLCRPEHREWRWKNV